MVKTLRIAVRKSPLALKQADIVKQLLKKYSPDLIITLLPMVTSGDQWLRGSLQDVGGKGLFIKELEQALLNHQADIAVHSMKDMPAESPIELETAIFLERDDPRDALISINDTPLSDIPAGSKIGTASVRRQSMIKHWRPDLTLETLRGNVNTRLSKLDKHQYAGIILAAAGLHRLDLSHRISQYFSLSESLPAIGQGIIGIQYRKKDLNTHQLLLPLDHAPTHLCILAERALNKALQGNCHSPIGGYAFIKNHLLYLKACVYSQEGEICIKAEKSEKITDLNQINSQINSRIHQLSLFVAQALYDQGAQELLTDKY